MIFKFLMAAVRKGPSGALDRVPSAGTRNKSKGAPLRSIHPNSSPVYKTQSETALTSGLSKLSINDTKTKPGLKRNFSSGRNSTNGSVKNITDVAGLLQNDLVKNVVVVAGAGISTPSGIPDFRSPGTGLYDNLQQYNIPYPEAIFDIDYFFVNPRPFFTLAKELYPSGKYRPNYIHYFVRQLYDKGLLLRMYTQNIDGLERLAGIPAEKLVEAHGTFATATCTACRQKLEGSEIKEKIFSDRLPRCPTRGCVGIVKPDIVFFGEDLPRKFYSYMKDMLQTDLVLVMGTSLEVQPFAGIIDTVHANVPRILFNREAVGPFKYSRRTQDLVSKGDLVENMVKFATMVGWKEDMVELITKEEGQFTIEPRKPPKGPYNSKGPLGKQLNKPPPAAPNRNKDSNRLLYRGRAKFTLYNDDSSSESSESDSDVTSSSESSDDGGRKNRFHGINGRKTVNATVRNGIGARRNNQVRATSAKINDTTKREFHSTQRNTVNGKFSPAGNISGRSIKSESAINNESTRRKVVNSNKNVPRETPTKLIKQKEAFVSPSKTDTISPKEKNKIGANLDLKVPGLPLVRNEMPLKHEDIVSACPNNGTSCLEYNDLTLILSNAEPNGPKEAFLSPVQSDKNMEQKHSPNENGTKTHLDMTENNIVRSDAKNEQVNKDDDKSINAVTERQKVSSTEREKVLKKYGIGTKPVLNNINKVPGQTEKLLRPMKSVKSDSAIACGYFIDELKQKSDLVINEAVDRQSEITDALNVVNDTRDISHSKSVTNMADFNPESGGENSDVFKENDKNERKEAKVEAAEPNSANNDEKNSVKLQEFNIWKEEISSRDKFLNMLDKKEGSIIIDGYASSAPSRTQNRNEKGSKVLNEKTARSFAKYAKFPGQKNSNKKHGKKPRRITLKDKPSAGPKIPSSKTELKVVNSKPYGFAHRQANVKGVGPFHRTNVRTLNSAIDRTISDFMQRSGSAEVPKITYRHKLLQTPVRDPHMFGVQTMAVTPALASDSSDD